MSYLTFGKWAAVAVLFCGCVLDYEINEQMGQSTESGETNDSSESTGSSSDTDTGEDDTDSAKDTGSQVDDCPGDPEKISPGVCGCGTPDTDSDGDGVANCVDQCPSDPRKTSPGSCGCGVSNCEDVCDAKQCVYGKCTEIGESSYCQCDPGWDGANCDQNIDDCSADPCDHGSCADGVDSYSCSCDAGWSGTNCDQNIDDCNPNPCVHGTCRDGVSTYACECEAGWTGTHCDQDEPHTELTWVTVPGGRFQMGSSADDLASEMPVHSVQVRGFEMTKTEVTVSQYGACMKTGACTPPDIENSMCNWGESGYDNHPVNCVDWEQAAVFCHWAGGRLPSESEWEYAARSGGQDITYPWGDADPTCEYAVMGRSFFDSGCGAYRTWEVCSKTAGNTDQGLCDMAGNVYEWVHDWLHSDYNGAPLDGSAWEIPIGSRRVIRGGSFTNNLYGMRAAYRYTGSQVFDYSVGFRCAR